MEANELVKWPNTKPESLQDLCIFYVVNNVRRIVASTTYRLMRTDNITLSHILGNQLLDYLINCCLPDISYFNRNQTEDIRIFFNKNFTDISMINLHNCSIQTLISLGVMDALKEHRLNEITLHCPLSENEVAEFTSLIQSQVNSLKKLTIPDTPGDSLRQIFLHEEDNHPQPSVREPEVFRDLSIVIEDRRSLESSSQHPVPSQNMLIFPNLTSLHLYTHDPCSKISFLGDIFRKHKTLSSCGIYTTTPVYDQQRLRMEPTPSMFLESLPHLTNLCSLCFAQCGLHTDAFECLATLQNLSHLDISFCTMEDGKDLESGHSHLVNLVQRLPKLKSLDISYTRFGGIIQSLETPGVGTLTEDETTLAVDNEWSSEVNPGDTAVLPGLEGRRFEFLGLWKVFPEVYELKNIPANRITSTACEEQIINALYTYQNNIPLLMDVMEHIDNAELYKPKDPYRMLWGVQLGLRTLLSQNEEELFLTLFYKLFSSWHMYIPQVQYREILVLILIIINKTMQPTIEEIRRVGIASVQATTYPCKRVMMYLTSILDTGAFSHISVYSYCFEQYVDTLCTLLKLMNPYSGGSSQYIVRGAKILYNTCLVGVDYTIQMGEMGVTERLLEYAANVTDFLFMKLEDPNLHIPHHFFLYMSMVWWSLFHLTDKLPENTIKFFSNDGVDLFIKTVQIYKSGDISTIIEENFDELAYAASGMIATLGNVSEVQSLSNQLLDGDFILAVRILLEYSDANHDVDTSVGCVCMLLHILSFQLEKWNEKNISTVDVLKEIKKAMFSWDVQVKREVSYRSLLPVFTLLEHEAFPKEEAQYVAAWILCNLTTVQAEVYCEMLRREDGEEIIKRVYSSLSKDQENTKRLLTDVMHNMTEFFKV